MLSLVRVVDGRPRVVDGRPRVVDGRPLRCSSSTMVLPSKNILASERLVLLTLHHLQRPAEVSMCCGGIVTEFNT